MISELGKRAGFFSTFFFTINHYLYCKKHRIKFTINSEDWMFKYLYGWTDYFQSMDIVEYEKDINKVVGHGCILEDFRVHEYKQIIPEIWIYNDVVKTQCEMAYEKLNLTKGEYCAIFIRRGDKLHHESKLILADEYLKIVLEKDPDCKKIFLQTDDYHSFLELKESNTNIEICTLCDPNQFGITLHPSLHSSLIQKNNHYIQQLPLCNATSISQMNPKEIKDHTLTMLVGLDIVLHSKYCVTDYQSNVSRFIKLAHPCYDNVFDVFGFDMKLDKSTCPAFENCVYDDIEQFRHS